MDAAGHARGALLLAACVAAYPAAHFYKQPELALLVPFVALSALINGFNSTKLFTASRQLELGPLTIIELSSQLAGIVVMLVLAWWTRSVWALACAALGTSIAKLVLGFTLLPGPGNRLRWDRSAVSALSKFGRWMFPSTVLTFFATSADRLIFGKLITIDALGVYSIASMWAAIPVFVLGHVFSNVVFPLLSRARNEGQDVAAWFCDTRRPVVIAAAWLATCLIAGGPTGMLFLYGQRGAAAGWIVQILAVGAWLHALENGNSNAVLAMGKPKWLAASNGAKVAGMFALIPCGYYLGGFPGAIWGFALADGLKCLVSMIAAARSGVSAWRQDLKFSAGIAALAALGHGVGMLVQRAGAPTCSRASRSSSRCRCRGQSCIGAGSWPRSNSDRRLRHSLAQARGRRAEQHGVGGPVAFLLLGEHHAPHAGVARADEAQQIAAVAAAEPARDEHGVDVHRAVLELPDRFERRRRFQHLVTEAAQVAGVSRRARSRHRRRARVRSMRSARARAIASPGPESDRRPPTSATRNAKPSSRPPSSVSRWRTTLAVNANARSFIEIEHQTVFVAEHAARTVPQHAAADRQVAERVSSGDSIFVPEQRETVHWYAKRSASVCVRFFHRFPRSASPLDAPRLTAHFLERKGST